MKKYVGVTDYEWFITLKQADCDEINFWKPGGQTSFKHDPFLLAFFSQIRGYMLWVMPAMDFAFLYILYLQLYTFLTCNFVHFYFTTNSFG